MTPERAANCILGTGFTSEAALAEYLREVVFPSVEAVEREACAEIAENYSYTDTNGHSDLIAKAIRERK